MKYTNKLKTVMKKTGLQIVEIETVNGIDKIKAVDKIVPILLIPEDIVINEINKLLLFEIDIFQEGHNKYYLLSFLWSQLGKKGLPYYLQINVKHPNYNKDKATKEYKLSKGIMGNEASALFIHYLNNEVAKIIYPQLTKSNEK